MNFTITIHDILSPIAHHQEQLRFQFLQVGTLNFFDQNNMCDFLYTYVQGLLQINTHNSQ